MLGGGVPEERNSGLDLLRGLIIVYIVGFWHLSNFVALPEPHNYLTWPLTKICLGTFFFLSAYFAGSQIVVDSWASIRRFYWRRFIRLYPLFLAAVLLFYFLGLTPANTALKAALGVATLVGPPPLTLWFVCMLLLLLFLTPAFVLALDRLRWPFYLALFIAVYGALSAYYYATGLLDEQLLVYMPVFIIGLAVARKRWKTPAGAWRLLLPCLLVLSAVIAYLITRGEPIDPVTSPPIIDLPMVALGAYCLFMAFRAMRFRGRSLRRSIYLLSFASYCMYLFHRPIYMRLTAVWYPSSGRAQAVYLFLVGLPLVILVSLAVQSVYDAAVRRLVD